MPTSDDSSLTTSSPRPKGRWSASLPLDDFERKISYAAAAVGLIYAAIYIPHLLKNTYLTSTTKALKDGSCPSKFHLVAKVCTKSVLTHPSYWWPFFIVTMILVVAMGLFAFFRNRVGIIVAGILIAFTTNVSAGFAFFILAAWLITRAYRLNKYGDASMKGAGQRSAQNAALRRQERQSRRGRAATPATESARPTPTPSKRYTPKKTPRR